MCNCNCWAFFLVQPSLELSLKGGGGRGRGASIKTFTLCEPKSAIFPTLFMTWSKFDTLFKTCRKINSLVQTDVKGFSWWSYRWWKSSFFFKKKHNYFKTRVQKPYPTWDQNSQIRYPISRPISDQKGVAAILKGIFYVWEIISHNYPSLHPDLPTLKFDREELWRRQIILV